MVRIRIRIRAFWILRGPPGVPPTLVGWVSFRIPSNPGVSGNSTKAPKRGCCPISLYKGGVGCNPRFMSIIIFFWEARFNPILICRSPEPLFFFSPMMMTLPLPVSGSRRSSTSSYGPESDTGPSGQGPLYTRRYPFPLPRGCGRNNPSLHPKVPLPLPGGGGEGSWQE